jgi:hypothetical protein
MCSCIGIELSNYLICEAHVFLIQKVSEKAHRLKQMCQFWFCWIKPFHETSIFFWTHQIPILLAPYTQHVFFYRFKLHHGLDVFLSPYPPHDKHLISPISHIYQNVLKILIHVGKIMAPI